VSAWVGVDSIPPLSPFLISTTFPFVHERLLGTPPVHPSVSISFFVNSPASLSSSSSSSSPFANRRALFCGHAPQVRNFAMGGVPSFPNSVCMQDFFGADVDLVVWDFRMVRMSEEVRLRSTSTHDTTPISSIQAIEFHTYKRLLPPVFFFFNLLPITHHQSTCLRHLFKKGGARRRERRAVHSAGAANAAVPRGDVQARKPVLAHVNQGRPRLRRNGGPARPRRDPPLQQAAPNLGRG